MRPIVLVLALLVVLLAGCQGLTVPANTGAPTASDTELPSTPTIEAASSESPEQRQLEGKVWILQSINGEPTLPDVEVTLEFSADTHRIRGYSGCNHYGGPYEVNDHKLDIVEVEMSVQRCPPEIVMEQERRYEDILWDVTAYVIEEGELTLMTDTGEMLVFNPQ